MAAGGRHIYRLPLWELGYQGGPGWTRKDEADNHTSRLSKASAATQEGEEPQTIAQQIKDRSKRPHAKWLEFHPLQSYYCCDGCGLLLHEKIPGCTLHAVESRFCPQCGTFYSPQQASEQKGRCFKCFHCPMCSALLLSRSKSETSEGDNKSYYQCGKCDWSSLQIVTASSAEQLADSMKQFIEQKTANEDSYLDDYLNRLAANIRRVSSNKTDVFSQKGKRRPQDKKTQAAAVASKLDHINRIETILEKEGFPLSFTSASCSAAFLDMPSTEKAEELVESAKKADFVEGVELINRKLSLLQQIHPSIYHLCKEPEGSESNQELQIDKLSEMRRHYEKRQEDAEGDIGTLDASSNTYRQLPTPYRLQIQRLIRCAMCQAESEPGILQRMESHFHSVNRSVPFSKYRKHQSALQMLPHLSIIGVKHYGADLGYNEEEEAFKHMSESLRWRECLSTNGNFADEKIASLPQALGTLEDLLPASPNAVYKLRDLRSGESAQVVAALQNPSGSTMKIDIGTDQLQSRGIHDVGVDLCSPSVQDGAVELPPFEIGAEDDPITFSLSQWLAEVEEGPGEQFKLLERKNHTALIQFEISKPQSSQLDDTKTYAVCLPMQVAFGPESQFAMDLKPSVRRRVEQLYGLVTEKENQHILFPYILKLRVEP
eukprot:gb/GECG01010665.1/.p1 GENE.gb/GECG01010665.1/~~gb/GECG01010665.1/.p1  ORF type:complete len:659 (+),score=87.91 gb/GECG01010665.1/:1-1977(+)